MTALDDVLAWLQENDPALMPFFPNAETTTWWGVRPAILPGTSPLHLGRDRAGVSDLRMPFDGRFYWTITGHAAGTIANCAAGSIPLVVQVMHTVCANPHIETISTPLAQGDELPVIPGNVGTSHGAHTHAEVLMPYDPNVWDWVCSGSEWIVDRDGRISPTKVRHTMMDAARKQVAEWGIEEMNTHGAIRRSLPDYRQDTLTWRGRTMVIDTGWMLDI